jgi:hypothetical protein
VTRAAVVRYTTRPERADENERLIRAVFAELAERHPPGFWYRAVRLADGVSFVHVAVQPADGSPLGEIAAFREFVAGIGDRCVDGPIATEGTVIGSFG